MPRGGLRSGSVDGLGDRQDGLVVALDPYVGVGPEPAPDLERAVVDPEVPGRDVVGQPEPGRRVGEGLADRPAPGPQRRLGGDGCREVAAGGVDPRVREELGAFGHVHWQHRAPPRRSRSASHQPIRRGDPGDTVEAVLSSAIRPDRADPH